MVEPEFQVYECQNPACRLRFSTDLSIDHFEKCPTCGSAMGMIGKPYSNFRESNSNPVTPHIKLSILLDNLRSTFNVGSIFRTANGAGVQHVYCCGTTPTPGHIKVKKSSLGSEQSTLWSYHPNSLVLLNRLHTEGNTIICLEYTSNSESLFEQKLVFKKSDPHVLVIGNEISGIDPALLTFADHTFHIPMVGIKSSLNVAVAAGIAICRLAFTSIDVKSDQTY